MAQMSQEELDEFNAALEEIEQEKEKPKKIAQLMNGSVEFVDSDKIASPKQQAEFYRKVEKLMEEGTTLLHYTRSVNYFRSMHLFALKELKKLDDKLELVDRL